jgi:chromate reductase
VPKDTRVGTVHPGRRNHLAGMIGNCEGHRFTERSRGRHTTGNSFFSLYQSEALKTQHGFSWRLSTNLSVAVTLSSAERLGKEPAMSTTRNVAVLVGSLRKDSLNRKVAKILIELAAPDLTLEIVEIGNLPLYNQDLETATPPAEWAAFRDRMRAADAVIFVTPEYNRSVPGALKNAIDVGSRPYGKSVFDKKPAGVISVSPGAIGAFGANQHLRQSLVFLNMPPMQQPEAYIGGADKLFDENGKLVNSSTREFLSKYVQAFAAWVERAKS